MLKSRKFFVKCALLGLFTFPSAGAQEADVDAFYRAVTDGSQEVVAPLLKAHPDWVDRELFFGIRPLYRASVLGRADIAQMLIEAGADVGARTDRGNQPLHAAAQNGYLSVVEILLSHKAPTDQANENGMTALHIAALYKRDRVLKELLRNGADPNIVDKRGRTPLHLAAGLGRLDLVQPLVESGASLSVVDKAGYSPLGWARTAKRNSYGDVGGYLEAKGAKDIRPPEKDSKKKK